MILIGMWPLQQPGTTEPRVTLSIPDELMARVQYHYGYLHDDACYALPDDWAHTLRRELKAGATPDGLRWYIAPDDWALPIVPVDERGFK